MSLTQVRFSPAEFDGVFEHLVSYYPDHRNMHLRDATYRQRNGERERVLLYLHAMYAHPGSARRIEGMISGPDVYWHYEIRLRSGRPQLNVYDEVASSRARERMARRFKNDILSRIMEEQQRAADRNDPDRQEYGPKRLPGHYYLQRSLDGASTHAPNCVAAVNAGVLDEEFVASLRPWNLVLLRP